jgi:hypothetical protein
MKLQFERSTPRRGNTSYEFQADVYTGGLSGSTTQRLGYDAKFVQTWYAGETLNVFAGLYAEHTPGWLIWQHDNLIGSFDQHTLQFDGGFNWGISERQELRLKLQAIGLDARLRQGYRVSATGDAVASDEAIADFSLRNLGVQIRWRYELAPLSYVYVVYGRGGFALDEFSRDTTSLLGDSFSLRDSDQLLVKLNYRFDW